MLDINILFFILKKIIHMACIHWTHKFCIWKTKHPIRPPKTKLITLFLSHVGFFLFSLSMWPHRRPSPPRRPTAQGTTQKWVSYTKPMWSNPEMSKENPEKKKKSGSGCGRRTVVYCFEHSNNSKIHIGLICFTSC